jgi:predicted outer membrane repeat protein
MRNSLFTCACALVVACLAGLPAPAGTIYVNLCGDDANDGLSPSCPTGPKKTIQAGVNAAADGDTVLVAPAAPPSTYTGAGNRNITWANKNIVVQCDDAAHGCVLDCAFGGRGFNFGSSITSDSKVIGFKIIRGKHSAAGDYSGGAFKLFGASPQILNNVIEDCSTGNHDDAGAIYITEPGARPIIRGNVFRRNRCEKLGGAIFAEQQAEPLIEENEFYENEADEGGAVAFECNGVVRGCVFGALGEGNTAGGSGGGFYGAGGHRILVRDCVFRGNTAGHNGGAMFFSGAFLSNYQVVGVTATNNTSAQYGGGIGTKDGANLRIFNSFFGANSANDQGGGLYLLGSNVRIYNTALVQNTAAYGAGLFADAPQELVVTNCTLADNIASQQGGGLFLDGGAGPAIVRNSILWNNEAIGTGHQIRTISVPVEVYRSNVRQEEEEDIFSPPGLVQLVEHVLNADPQFVEPGANYSLRSLVAPDQNPCIDAADNGAVGLDELDLDLDEVTLEEITPVDLAGNVRMVDDPNTANTGLPAGVCTHVDMGAFEYVGGDVEDCNSNGISDMCDRESCPPNEWTCQDCNVNSVLDGCEDGPFPAKLIGSTPDHNKSWWRPGNNIARLVFSCDIETPGPMDVQVREMKPGGQLEGSVSSSFTFVVEETAPNRPRRLRIRQNTGENVILHRKWYAIRNSGDWAGVENFCRHYQAQHGDADNNGSVTGLDVSLVNSGLTMFYGECLGTPGQDDDRRDINGDCNITGLDVSIINGYLTSFPVAKPGGHENCLPPEP